MVQGIGLDGVGQLPGHDGEPLKAAPSAGNLDRVLKRGPVAPRLHQGVGKPPKRAEGVLNVRVRLLDTMVGEPLRLAGDPADDPVVGLDNGVRNGGAPFHDADRQYGQAAVAGDVEKAVGEVPLALPAQTRDPVGRNAVENRGGQVQFLQEFEPVEQAVGIGRVVPHLELPQPYEPARVPVRAFAQQAVEALAHPAVETCGDPGIDPAFRRDQGIRAEPLDGRHGRQDDKPAAALLDEASHQVLSGTRRFGMLCQPGLHPAHALAREHPVAVDLAQRDKVLLPGLAPCGVLEQGIPRDSELGTHELQHFLRNDLSGLQKAPRPAESAELECESKLVFRAPPGANMFDVVIRQRVVLQQGCLVRGQVENGSALAR